MIGKGKGYAKLSNGFWRDPKILSLLQESPSALGVYLACISYCSDNLTDGRIPAAIITGIFHAADSDVAALRKHHLMSKQGDDFTITAYLNWQLSKEQIEKHKENRKDRNARYYVKTKQEDSLKTGLKTGLKTTKHKNIKHKNINKREGREKNANHENDAPRSQPFSLPQKIEDDWKARLESWEPKPDHFERSRTLRDSGYPSPDIPALAQEFKHAVAAKRNWYGYEDFDAAFHVWIDKRAASMREKSSGRDPSPVSRPTPTPQLPKPTPQEAKARAEAARENVRRAKAVRARWEADHPGQAWSWRVLAEPVGGDDVRT